MTLITAIIGGLLCGYFLGFGRRAFGVFVVVWASALLIQTTFLVSQQDKEDVLYWPFQAIIFGVAVLMVWLGTRLRTWRAHAT
jgi:hypothetical protein